MYIGCNEGKDKATMYIDIFVVYMDTIVENKSIYCIYTMCSNGIIYALYNVLNKMHRINSLTDTQVDIQVLVYELEQC